MQVGEQHLALAHPAVLRLDGLLDLQQQVGLAPHLVGGVDKPRAGRGEVRVMDGRPLAGPGLDYHLVAAMHQFGGTGRSDSDAILVVLDLSRDADAHGFSLIADIWP